MTRIPIEPFLLGERETKLTSAALCAPAVSERFLGFRPSFPATFFLVS